MRPTAGNLSTLVNQTLTMDVQLGPSGGSGNTNVDGARVLSHPVQLQAVPGGGRLVRGDGPDHGLWVPYSENQCVVGYASAGQTWLASGPFSGCHFAVGKAGDGRIFAAHVSKQSGSTGPADWQRYLGDHQLELWYSNAIPLPSETFYAASYMFVELGGGGIQSMNRLDVRVTTMGGGNGTVFNLKTFK
jgi:hypothetical protein